MMLGRFSRAIAITLPGMFLSQPGSEILASYHCARITVSIESAIISRDGSDDFIPSVPIEMPSLTPIVWKIRPTNPASCTPRLTSFANSFRCMLHGLPSQPMLAIPTWAFCISSSVMPIPYSIACEPTCERFCVNCALYLFNMASYSFHHNVMPTAVEWIIYRRAKLLFRPRRNAVSTYKATMIFSNTISTMTL
ncbi:hypothetical protein U14_02332 [Candidatus Moduliflexus flocculans]|uniref:Uncharacterized protein n=1 Tax=Candidatus Moduliflexus flocculans TaxID=1499966 RepID=A0A0S6VUC9_9BACT|nr:hypothetical protein U14_02332 [Candidatus Moduliflexus flocculans]